MTDDASHRAQPKPDSFRINQLIAALALQPLPAGGISSRMLALALGGHAAGLLLGFRLAHWPLWLAPVALLAAWSVSWLATRSRSAALIGLTPLAVLYATALVRLVLTRITSADVPAWLDYRWSAVLAGAWIALILLPRRVLVPLGLGVTLIWAAGMYLLNRPAGVTASDPYVYVQMALDLAEHGTPMHAFPLARRAFELGLPVYPTLHVGYKIPYGGLSPSVWPPGFSALLAIAYRLTGEAGMFLVNPVLGVLSLLGSLWLAILVLRERHHAWISGALAVFILATSLEQYTRLTVPLADVAAQVFTTLALCLGLRRTPSPQPLAPVLTGLAFGLAYAVRYTQLLAMPAFIYMGWTSPRRWRFLLLFGLAALVVALPDLVYHATAFGAPWRTGSDELGLFSLASIPSTSARMLVELLAWKEFGLLLPLAALGAAVCKRPALVVLALAYLPPLVFHLPYPFLRLRDLLWSFPPLAMLCAAGLVALVTWFGRRLGNSAAPRALAVGVALVWILSRWAGTLPLTQGYFTFGMLQAEQRRSLEALAALTESNAVVASSLNSGAVELYGHRPAVRPGRLLQPGAGWTDDDWLRFIAAMHADGRPVYLLMDGEEMQRPRAVAAGAYRLMAIAELDVPYYVAGGASENRMVRLYRIEE